MSKFMFTMLAGLGLALGAVFAESALAARQSDVVNPFNSAGQFVLKTEAAADAKFDEGHRKGYLCTYYHDPDGTQTWVVQWYKK